MLFCVDIGNTFIHAGLFDRGGRLKYKAAFPASEDGIKAGLLRTRKQFDRCIITSVVPSLLDKTEEAVRHMLGVDVSVVGRDAEAGVKNLYRRPGQVGQDRLVNARAAFDYYGGPAIIVDFGTAITIDLVNGRKEYMGGVIAPGIELSMNALSEKAALLPYVKLRRPGAIIAKGTRESMLNGAVYGFAGLCDSIVKKIEMSVKKRCRVIATGGLCSFMSRYCKTVRIVDPLLTLKGLFLIAGDRDV